jgi:hypothetical protein
MGRLPNSNVMSQSVEHAIVDVLRRHDKAPDAFRVGRMRAAQGQRGTLTLNQKR